MGLVLTGGRTHAPRRLTLAVVFTMARSFAAASLERVLLDEGRGDREDDDDRDHDRRPDVAEEIGDCREREKQGVQGILGPPPQFSQDARASLPGDDVGSDRRQPCLRLGATSSPLGEVRKP